MNKTIKYKDHYLTLKHYKEPLKEVEKGFGYFGCLLNTVDGEFVQCHMCGHLCKSLQAHVQHHHDLTAKEYREKYQLTYQTSLISESEREKRKLRFQQYWESLTLAQKEERRRNWVEWHNKATESRQKNGHRQPKIRLETKNKRGTCPDQLIEKIHEVTKKLGRTPSLKEFVVQTGGQRFKHLILKTFGSWLEALKIAKLTPKIRVEGVGGRKNPLSKDQMLEELTRFASVHKKIPTRSDFKRGLLNVTYETYCYHFGTLHLARFKAGVYNIVPLHTLTVKSRYSTKRINY